MPVARFAPPDSGGGDGGDANRRTGRHGISPARVTYGVDMGVFARLLGRSKATEEASTADEQSVAVTDEPAAAETEAAKGSPEAGSGAETETTAEKTEAVAVPAAEGVEIPKQQSAEEAADSEAGEGARK